MIVLFLFLSTLNAIDLEQRIQDFVLETQKIEIPNSPYAFNPSIVFWRGSYILCFRELIQAERDDSSGPSRIGLVFLNEHFSLEGDPYFLDFLGADARLVNVDEHLYVVCEGGFRMIVGELDFDGEDFILKTSESLTYFPEEDPLRREKNWVPFNYQGKLLLSYSLEPHEILEPFLDGSEECLMIESTSSGIIWPWGELRGGTPALRCGNEYLAFFHSSINMASDHSEGKVIPHYFMGAYTFQKDPPFRITRISKEPIIGRNFYHGLNYPPYWHPVQVIFPCGFVFDDDYIWVAYGRQDHEIWMAKLSKSGLFKNLFPLSP